MRIRRLTHRDVDDGFTLSRQAEWNQCPADWRRLVDLHPDTCFAGIVDGEVVATGTLATYGDAIGWIGMILVDEAHRRNGYGTELLDRTLSAADAREISVVGLDATMAGEPLYRDRGFETVAEIDRWSGTIDSPREPVAVRTVEPGDRAAVCTFDEGWCGVDRSALLAHLLSSSSVTGLVRRRSGDVEGYAVVRPGRTHWQVGPVVATCRETAAELFAAAETVVGDDSVIVDAVVAEPTAELLTDCALSVHRRLSRMTRNGTVEVLNSDGTFATAGFEWG